MHQFHGTGKAQAGASNHPMEVRTQLASAEQRVVMAVSIRLTAIDG